MPGLRHILILRFSALGDIAMTVPVIKNLLYQHPSLEVTVVSVPFVRPLFAGIDRLHFFDADIKKEYAGISGLWRLSRKLKKEISFDAVADLHNVLRTKILRFFLATRTAVIDKGRKEKKELTRPVNKIMRPLLSVFQRYANVFGELGFAVELNIREGYNKLTPDPSFLPPKENGNVFIGVAPFAKHAAKMYPLDKMKAMLQLLLEDKHIQVFVFATREEYAGIRNWDNLPERFHFMTGKMSFEQELNVISQLDAMVSMDSANMHLASLFSIPVISIWGGTHPYLGFYGWGQPYNNVIQSDLSCRPSSVFGEKECPVHGSAGCMQEIKPAMIVEKLLSVLSPNSTVKR